ncbi:hypothetical protein K450DRAFT_244139 [Umbelopsis ramanniana AG]|uniref:Vacuolar fusion protein MON1 n=1 Tax=Umbelopsis ramanniana AG TaxID=1314678 RepID=A0AAD5E8R4_UMBRA|nr:uncharacterized protein K450DRAFT_244139 [Umbelopsis ramanniana AG]KAI8578932.1 hypothetical protein K450DRAFT_244139 [Umbelopsis ramanniana AG]
MTDQQEQELSTSLDSSSSIGSSLSENNKMYNKLKRQGSRSSVLATRPGRSQSISKDSQKQVMNEDPDTKTWSRHKKHFFILSSAGKPIWTRYGDEAGISSLMGVIQAIISFFQADDDSVKCMNAGHHKFVFQLKDPLYLVAVAKTGESEAHLRDQLLYLHSQILSVLTSLQLTKIFEQRINFDLRRLLSGTEVFLDSLSTLFNNDHGFMLGALQCLRVSKTLRDQIGNALADGRPKDLLYAIIVSNGKLVTLLRPRKHSLHPSDLHLLFNMLTGSTTFRTAESWTPLCLPKLNSKGFLHAYICYIERDTAVVMISTNKDSFFELSDWKKQIVETLTSSGALLKLQQAADESYSASDIGIPALRHFIYKSKMHIQFTCPELEAPYTNPVNRRRLHRLYQRSHDRLHSKTRPLKLYYLAGEHESILGWITSSFELYVVFNATVPKSTVITSSNHLLRWIKKHEDMLFILNSPVF